MCGIAGIMAKSAVNQTLFDALTVLQHRGQDAAGILTSDGKVLYLRKGNGLVRDVFRTRHMLRLKGNMGIGHVRYPTAGSSSAAEAQPFYVNSPFGISLAHNGNLVNAAQLREELFVNDRRHLNTDSDSEVLLNILAHELQEISQLKLSPDDIFNAIARVNQRCQGGYAVVAMIHGHGVIGFRDPHGIRPLVYGIKHTEQGDEYMIASESVALDALGFKLVDDVAPGEVIYIDMASRLHRRIVTGGETAAPCIFEFVYLSRPDSIMEGVSIYQARLNMGERLAEKIRRDFVNNDIDVVIPVPDTSRTAAIQLAQCLQVSYREGLIKNRYIGRTFIMPGQHLRKRSVRQKLNAIDSEFAGKNVLLVDDSLVRGTTSKEIVQMARDAGARKVYFASAAPPVKHVNVYGIDMPSLAELVAHDRSVEEICAFIGADRLFFQDLSDLIAAIHDCQPKLKTFDTSVFDGHYVCGKIDEAYLQQLSSQRGEFTKQQTSNRGDIVGIHND